MISPALPPKAFANILHSLRYANQRHQDMAREVRDQNLRLFNHARSRASCLGLSIDVNAAIRCPQNQVAVLPLPILDLDPSPRLVSYFSPISPSPISAGGWVAQLHGQGSHLSKQDIKASALKSLTIIIPNKPPSSSYFSPISSEPSSCARSSAYSPGDVGLQPSRQLIKANALNSLKISIPPTPASSTIWKMAAPPTPRLGYKPLPCISADWNDTQMHSCGASATPPYSSLSSAPSIAGPKTPSEPAVRVFSSARSSPKRKLDTSGLDGDVGYEANVRQRWSHGRGYANRDAIQIFVSDCSAHM